MLSRALSILCQHEPEDVMELELDAEFQAHSTSAGSVRVNGQIYTDAKTFYFTDGSTLSVVEDGEGGFVVVSDAKKSPPPGGWRH